MNGGRTLEQHGGRDAHVPQARTPADGVGVLSRTAMVLRCFDARHPRLTLAKVVRRSGLPKTTAHRLLTELCSIRMLSLDNHEYCIGQRVFELASLSPLSLELREVAVPFMQDLYQASQETVHLGVRMRHEVLYVEKIRGHRQVTQLGRTGSSMPLYCTGLGKAILAFSTAELVEEVLTGPLLPRTRHTIVSAAALRRELAVVAERGVAFDREEAAIGLGCVAAPILDASNRPVAALSVSVPVARRRLDQLASAVQTAALSISRGLGRQGLL
ncbi:MAG: IclR family transcriptional regulator [Frankiales bacterium]|nr:IclR family transcriptional regulator [Frankiales bacterium]